MQKKGFKSLQPIFLEGEDELYDQFLIEKKEKLNKNKRLYSLKDGTDDDLDDDDDIISDPKFAALLNEDRAIYVKDTIYIYTTEGVYFSNVENEEYLYDYLKGRDVASKDKVLSRLALTPCDGGTNRIDEYISLSCGGGGGGTYVPPTTSSSVPATLPVEVKQKLGYCNIGAESIWQGIFGEAETCHDYFDSKRRVKVKFWNQNYKVYSSIGISVKYQKKYWLGWQKSDAVDFTELGVNYAAYTYSLNISPYNYLKDHKVISKYRGISYNADGTIARDLPIEVQSWPFDNSQGYPDGLELYFFGQDYNGVKGKQLNELIIEYAKKAAKNFFKGLSDDLAKDSGYIKAVLVDELKDEVRVIVINKIKRSYGDGDISHTFDKNALFTFKYSQGDDKPTYNFTGAKSYKDVEINFYGVARRDGKIYRGKRMGYKE